MSSPTNGGRDKQYITELITKLQTKQKVFVDSFSAPDALDLMNNLLEKVIRAQLVGIYKIDAVFGKFLCHVFFRKRIYIEDENSNKPSENYGEMWQKTKEPLYCLLVAAYVSNAMAHTFSDQEDFRQNHEYYESLAWSFFDEMYQNNEKKLEYHVLAYDYESFYKVEESVKNNPNMFGSVAGSVTDNLSMFESVAESVRDNLNISKSVAGSDANNPNMSGSVGGSVMGLMNEEEQLVNHSMGQKKEKSSRELLCVAYRGQCMKFISHVACQNYIKARWEHGKVDKLFEDERDESSRTSSVTLRTIVPWTPQNKYRIHMIFNLVFIVFFAMVLLKKPWKQIFGPDPKGGTFNWWTFAFFYVLLSLILETAEQVLKTLFILKIPVLFRKRWRKAYWWADYQVRLLRFAPFMANCFLFYLAVFKIYPSIFFPVCEILFTASFVLSTIITLKYFSFSNYFGAKIQLIREMTKSIFMYMAILVVFWIIYAVCYLSLTEGISTNQEHPVWQLFQNGVFEILGESRDEDRDGIISNCSNVRWESVDFEKPDQVSCLFRSSLIPPLLFMYMMTATIMLINIFTAMLSHKYEVSNQNAANYSRFQKYETLARFESKIFFPRPLNIIYIVGWIFYKIGKNGKHYVQHGCLSDKSPSVSWFSSVRSWGSGPKDSRVDWKEVKNLVERVRNQRRTNDFIEAAQQLITDWKQTHQNPENDRIEEAHKVLQGVIGKYKDFLSTETEGVRR